MFEKSENNPQSEETKELISLAVETCKKAIDATPATGIKGRKNWRDNSQNKKTIIDAYMSVSDYITETDFSQLIKLPGTLSKFLREVGFVPKFRSGVIKPANKTTDNTKPANETELTTEQIKEQGAKLVETVSNIMPPNFKMEVSEAPLEFETSCSSTWETLDNGDIAILETKKIRLKRGSPEYLEFTKKTPIPKAFQFT